MFLVAIITAVASFTLGVLYHRYVMSEAASIKAHVSAEVAVLRTDVHSLIATGKTLHNLVEDATNKL